MVMLTERLIERASTP